MDPLKRSRGVNPSKMEPKGPSVAAPLVAPFGPMVGLGRDVGIINAEEAVCSFHMGINHISKEPPHLHI
jgi:hypothetical protein